MSATVSLRIDGMTCAASVSRVERALMRVPGVGAAEVSVATGRAGRPAALDMRVARKGDECRVLSFAAAVESGSMHPLAYELGIAVGGGGAMAFSSLAVVQNSLRIARWRPANVRVAVAHASQA